MQREYRNVSLKQKVYDIQIRKLLQCSALYNINILQASQLWYCQKYSTL